VTDILEVSTLVERAQKLVPVPTCAVRLANIVGRPDASLDELVQIISFDQVLTLKLLRAANSAASGSALRIATVEDAVSRLGGARVASMAVAFAVRGPMQQTLAQYDLEEGELWRHSVASAVAAELIPTVAYVAVPPESFTASLLHDCGKLIICQFAPAPVLEAILRARKEGVTAVKAERKVLGYDHGEVGAALAKTWNLPATIVRGISAHHLPDKAAEPVCDVVCVSNAAAKHLAATLKGAKETVAPPLTSLERLELKKEEFDELCRRMPQRYKAIAQCYEA
jgi:HD-like signal output (HDOD) protein